MARRSRSIASRARGGPGGARIAPQGRHGVARTLECSDHDAVLGIHLRQQVGGDAGTLEVRPGHLVLALVVVGQLGVEVVPRPAELRRPGGVAVRKLSSAPAKRSRSRRTAPWITLFMLIVAIGPA